MAPQPALEHWRNRSFVDVPLLLGLGKSAKIDEYRGVTVAVAARRLRALPMVTIMVPAAAPMECIAQKSKVFFVASAAPDGCSQAAQSKGTGSASGSDQ